MSFTPAKTITSSQNGVHERLEAIIDKYLLHKHRKPIAEHNREMFNRAYDWYQTKQQANPQIKTILDSGCGTGESSRFF